MIDVHYDSIKSNDQSQNISQLMINRSKSYSQIDIVSSQHCNGANIRQNMFTLNEDILMMQKKNKDDSDIIESTILTNYKLQNEYDFTQSQQFTKKDKLNSVPVQQQSNLDKRQSLYQAQESLEQNKLNHAQSRQGSCSVEEMQDNMQNMYDQQLDKDSKRFQLNSDTNQSPIQQYALGSKIKLQGLSLQPLNSQEPTKEALPKNMRYSNRSSQIAMSFFTKLKISQITRKFLYRIKSFSQKYNFSKLTKKHYDIINDKSAFYQEHKIQEELQGSHSKKTLLLYYTQFIILMFEFFESIQPLNPESRFSVLCDLIYGIVLLGYLFVVPIQLSFMVTFYQFELIAFIVFIVNFFLTLNKCYYHEGRIIHNRKRILINFMKTSFFIDLAVFISLRIHMFQYIVFLKFFDINRIVKRADNHFQIIRRIPIAFSLINLVVKMTLIAQIAGCTFHYVARLEIEDGQKTTWLSAQHMTDKSWQNRYIISIYFAFITMMTVGYGDVTPVNNHERIYVIFMTLLSSGIFGYVVNTIGQLYHQQAQKQEQFQKRKQEITVYMDERTIESDTKIKVLNYLEYAFQYNKKKDQNPLVLFQDIPSSLVDEIYIKYYGRYLFQNKMMKLNFSENSLKALSICMKEKNLAPNEYLYKKGTKESKVYFIVSGKVEVVLEGKDESNSFETIQKQGDEIGLRSSFLDQERSTSVVCSKEQNCSLVYFEMDDFKNILQQFPKDYERYCELRDDIMYNSNTLDTKCASCHRYDHFFAKCPLISLNIFKENFIYRYNNNGEPQIRKIYQRRGRKLNCLIQHEEFRQKLKEFRMSLVFLIIPELRENRQNIQMFQDRSDKFFFNKMPTVKILEGGDLEADMEEYNIYDGYQTMAHDELNHQDPDEESDSDNHLRPDEDRLLVIQGESGENFVGSSSYSSSNQQPNQQLYPQQLQIQINPSSVKEVNQSNIQITNSATPTSQKMSLFAKKSSQNIEIPSNINNNNNNNNDVSSLVLVNQINQPSSRNLSFRRERGDSFYPPKRNSKQYSQQRSLQSRAKSARKLSEIHQASNRPGPSQVSFINDNGLDAVESQQAIITDLFLYDFDKMKIYEKYFPKENYNYVLNRINKKRINIQKPKRVHKTIIINSPKKRLSQKIPKQGDSNSILKLLTNQISTKK